MLTSGVGGVLVLGGPTASGKTTFAIALAQRYGAEIVSADSRQIYRDMAIGTAAPTPAQQARVRHHLVGWLDPYERYSAARFVEDATAAIRDIHARGNRAMIVGGTGFYLRALCGDVDLAAQPDPALRERVLREARMHPAEVLHEWLQSRDPQRAAVLSPRDPYRIVRALEIDLGRSRDAHSRDGRSHDARSHDARSNEDGVRSVARARALPTLRAAGIPFAKLALRADRVELERRIAERTAAMLALGLIEEAERIGSAAVAADAVGYREASAYQCGWLTGEELSATLTRATRRYAKRQLTWLRGESGLTWVDFGDFEAVAAVVERIGWTPTRSVSLANE